VFVFNVYNVFIFMYNRINKQVKNKYKNKLMTTW